MEIRNQRHTSTQNIKIIIMRQAETIGKTSENSSWLYE